MLSKYLKFTPEENSSIHVSNLVCPYFKDQDHFHSELELNLIVQSTGTRFIGDSIESFKEDDLVLLGPNIAHYWKNDPSYYKTGSSGGAQAIVVRFPEHFLGKGQYNLPEMNKLKNLFKMAERGLLVDGLGRQRVITSIKKMSQYDGMERLIIFLGILNAIANTCELNYLSSEGFMKSLSDKNEKRMNTVYNYIVNNFNHKIALNDIAVKAEMNPSAFSRFFSQCTGKSVTGFLQEIRVAYACKLLKESKMNISDIMHESGFLNQAYFNKLFVEKKGVTPKAFRNNIVDKL